MKYILYLSFSQKPFCKQKIYMNSTRVNSTEVNRNVVHFTIMVYCCILIVIYLESRCMSIIRNTCFFMRRNEIPFIPFVKHFFSWHVHVFNAKVTDVFRCSSRYSYKEKYHLLHKHVDQQCVPSFYLALLLQYTVGIFTPVLFFSSSDFVSIRNGR